MKIEGSPLTRVYIIWVWRHAATVEVGHRG